MKNTPLGSHALFDAHTHFLSHSFMQKLGVLAKLGDDSAVQVCDKLGWVLPPRDPVELGRKWVAELDAHGVDRAVMFHTLPGDAASLATAVKAFSDRLVGFLMLNPTEPSAMSALSEAVTGWGFRGVTLFPAMHRFDPSSESLDDLFRFADAHKLVVFVHCGVLKVGFRKALGLPSAFDGTKGNPLALQRRAAEYTNVRFVIPHLGSGMLRELLMLGDVCPNVYTDTSGLAGWARYLPGRVSLEDCLKQVLDVLGPGRVLFGSDSSFFPRGWREDVFAQQMEVFSRMGLSGDEVGGILGGNLSRIVAGGP